MYLGLHKPKSLKKAVSKEISLNIKEDSRREPSAAILDSIADKSEYREVADLEAEIERYSRFLDELETLKNNPEHERELELFPDSGADSALSVDEKKMILAKIKKWEEHENLIDKFMKEASPDNKTPAEFYEQLIKEKKQRIEVLKKKGPGI